MDFISLISQNMLSPAILFFALGIAAGLLKSDLEVPDSISRYLSLYLMMAIGFKGGVAIATTPSFDGEVFAAIGAGLMIGFLQPFIGYGLLKVTTRVDSATAAAIAAHYGSISIVTFATAVAFLGVNAVSYAGYVVAIVALMEAPAILSGLFIAHRAAPETGAHAPEEKKLSREIFTNGAILLLSGAFLVGWITGPAGMQKLEGFRIAAVCDTDPGRLDAIKRRVKDVPAFATHAELLDKAKDVKAVVIATPTHTHKAVAVDSLAAGKHVFCEAPLAHTVDDAKAIAKAAAKATTIFQSGLYARSNPVYKLARTFFRSDSVRDLIDRKSTRLNSSHSSVSRMPSSA